MSQVENIKCCNTALAVRRQVLGLLLLALAIACGDGSTPIVRGGSGGAGAGGGSAGSGGTSGFGASAGTGGMAGSGGTAGTGGTAGSGGSAGSGGAAGSGGIAGSGGTAGTGASGGSSGACATNALCHTCPTSGLCDGNDDCPSGRVCVPSGCETYGDPIKQCMPSWAGSCSSDAECPNQNDYDCLTVGAGGKRCVRVASGCNPATETYDCAPGFSCESGTCVDRRMPCDSYENCPKSHICLWTPVSQYCARVSRTCHLDEDCSWIGNNFGTFCADVDGDLRKECIGERDATGTACVSSDCGSSVCETGAVGSAATCGDYGLCRFNSDCGSGFECLDLWQDGRKECVLDPGPTNCQHVTDCPLQQVCAAPRIGGPPSCQAGTAP